MPVTTVLQARTEERHRLQEQLLRAQLDLVKADDALRAALDDIKSATKALALLQSSESTIRQQLAVAAMPGLIDQLEKELENNLRSQRPHLFTLSQAQDRSAQGQRSRDRMAVTVDQLRAQVAQQDALVAQAARDDDQSQPWREALSRKVPALITAADGDALKKLEADASARVKRLLGDQDALVALVRARYDDAAGQQADRQARLEAAVEAVNAVLSASEVLTTAETYARARDSARQVAEDTESQLAWIERTYRLAAATPDLAPGEQSRIDDRGTAAAATPAAAEGAPPGKSPAQLLTDLHTARAEKRKTQIAFDRAVGLKTALDPNFDGTTDKSVKDERDAAAAAKAKFDEAEAACKPDAVKAAIDDWDVAVPPTVMQMLSDVLRAQALRADIKGIDAGKAAEALDQAETAYAEALAADAVDRARAETLNAEVLARRDEVAAVAAVADQRVAAAVRGDE